MARYRVEGIGRRARRARRLIELGGERLSAMEETGLDVQVLSLTSPGVQNLAPDDAVATPDRLQRPACRRGEQASRPPARPRDTRHPGPGRSGSRVGAGGDELGLNGAMLFGRTRERNLDHPDFRPIFEAAAALNAPLYLHPQSPLPTVRAAYYSGLGDAVDAAFATHGIGWHYETGVQLLRLILSGVFDRFPGLQVIVGHWGEVVLFYLERIEKLAAAAKLERPLADYFRNNVFVTPSGMFSQRYLRWATEVMGIDRILFSTDYPFRICPAGRRPPLPGGGGLERSRPGENRIRQLGPTVRRDSAMSISRILDEYRRLTGW